MDDLPPENKQVLVEYLPKEGSTRRRAIAFFSPFAGWYFNESYRIPEGALVFWWLDAGDPPRT